MVNKGSPPAKAQWGLTQGSPRRDGSPSQPQWGASITLRALHSDTVPLQASAQSGQEPRQPRSPTASSTFTRSRDTSQRDSVTSNVTMLSSAPSLGIYSVQSEPISPRSANVKASARGFAREPSKNRARLNHFDLSIETGAEAMNHVSKLGMYSVTETVSPTSTVNGTYRAHPGNQSPGNLVPQPLITPSASRFSIMSEPTTPSRRGAGALIEEMARTMGQGRSGRPSPKSGSEGTDYSSERSHSRERRSPSSRGSSSSSGNSPGSRQVTLGEVDAVYDHEMVKQTQSKASLLKKAFRSGSKKDPTVSPRRSSISRTKPIPKMSPTSPPRSIMRPSKSNSALATTAVRSPRTLARMISAPVLMDSSMPASPLHATPPRSYNGFAMDDGSSISHNLDPSYFLDEGVSPLDIPQRLIPSNVPPRPPKNRLSAGSPTSSNSAQSRVSASSSNSGSPRRISQYGDLLDIEEQDEESPVLPSNDRLGTRTQQPPPKLSSATSVPSDYDQESFDGHSSPVSQQDHLAPRLSPKDIIETMAQQMMSPGKANAERDDPVDSFVADATRDSMFVQRHESSDEDMLSSDDDDDEVAEEDGQNALADAKQVPDAQKATHYKIIRTSQDNSQDMESLDSIHLFSDTLRSIEASKQPSASLARQMSQRSIRTQSGSSGSQTLAELSDDVEVDHFMTGYGKRLQSIRRTSGLFDLDAMAQHAWPVQAAWRNPTTGKLNSAGFALATVFSALAYLSPIQFRDIHAPLEQSNTSNDVALEHFHLDTLKDNGERLFVSAVPLYEHLFTNLAAITRWESKVHSTIWSLLYFGLWYYGVLITGMLSLVVLQLMTRRGRRTASQKQEAIALGRRQSRVELVQHLHSPNKWANLVAEAQTDATSNKEQDGTVEALRKYGQLATHWSGRMADAHERVGNMSRWARTPATMRTVVVLSLLALTTALVSANTLVRWGELWFGLHFFFLAPLHRARPQWFPFLAFDLIDLFLAGVPNDAQNAMLILRRRMLAQRQKEQKQEEQQAEAQETSKTPITVDTPRAPMAAIVEEQSESDADSAHEAVTPQLEKAALEVQPSSPTKRTGIRVEPRTSSHTAKPDAKTAPWSAPETTFGAFYQGQPGLVLVTDERISFQSLPMPSMGGDKRFSRTTGAATLFSLSLHNVVQLDKVCSTPNRVTAGRHAQAPSNGIRITARRSGATVQSGGAAVSFTLLGMDLRDEAFNRIMALAPHHWHRQAAVPVTP